MAGRTRRSAGILLYRRRPTGTEVLIVHPGGPYFARRDAGWWSIPKGEVGSGEEELASARREFEEELGIPVPEGESVPLGEVVQTGGKRVVAWAVEGDADVATISSNTFEMEWPPRSGRRRSFPEVDRALWCSVEEARLKLLAGQSAFLDRLEELDERGTGYRTTTG
jgi:predicted NUDIX family NTP pyrophosphohydrolase